MTSPNPCRGFRVPAEAIQHAVWLDYGISLSPRDVETILGTRGVVVGYESIRDWSLRFGRLFANTLKRCRPKPGDEWHLDELFLRIRGKLHHLWRAGNQYGTALDVLVQSRRIARAATRFFRKLLRGLQYVPRVLVTDKLRSDAAAKREELPGVEHRQSRCLNHRAKCRTSRQGGENGRCSGSSQHGMRSASTRPTAASTTTSSSAANA